MVQAFDGLGDDVLDALKNTPTAQLDEAMDGLAAVLRHGVDPGVVKNALNNSLNFGTAYKQAELLVDLKLLADVPGLGHCLDMMKINNVTVKGFRYEIEGAAALKRQGMDIVEMGRRAAIPSPTINAPTGDRPAARGLTPAPTGFAFRSQARPATPTESSSR